MTEITDKKEAIDNFKNKDKEISLHDVSDDLRADKEVVIAALERKADESWAASDELKADKEVVMVAVTKNGAALKYASPELKSDRAVVLAAVANRGLVCVNAGVCGRQKRIKIQHH